MSVNLSKPEHINSDMRDQSRTSDKKRVGKTYAETRAQLHDDTRDLLRDVIADVMVEAFEHDATLSPRCMDILRTLSQASENVLELATIEFKQDQPNGGTQQAAIALLRAWLHRHQGADMLSQATRKWLGVDGEDIGGFEVGDFEQEAGRIDREETDADSKQPDPIPTKQQLIDAIMVDWPNAVIMQPSSMYAWADKPIKSWIKLSRFRQLAHATLQRGHGVFYSPMEGVHGYRYGLEESEYVSIMGFSEL